MPGSFTVVDLSQLPAPAVVEQIDYETILADMLAYFRGLDPAYTALVESDPAYKILEVCAYREMLLRQRNNESCLAVMVTFARGSDLDQLAANFKVQRLLISPADDDAIPPIPAVYESDEDFRARIPMSLEGYTTAGSEGSYVFHGLSADGRVKDVSAVSPVPGYVTVYVLSREGDGTASDDLINTVTAALNAENTRPMTDHVTVLSSSIVTYSVAAELVLYPGPAISVVLEAARTALQKYVTSMHRNGYDVALSGIYQALHLPGMVQRVNLISPTANIVVAEGQAAYCDGMLITAVEQTDA